MHSLRKSVSHTSIALTRPPDQPDVRRVDTDAHILDEYSFGESPSILVESIRLHLTE